MLLYHISPINLHNEHCIYIYFRDEETEARKNENIYSRNAAIANEKDDSWPSSNVLILVVLRIPRGMRNYVKYFLHKVYRSSKGKSTTTWKKKSTNFVFFQYKEMRGFLLKKHFSHKVLQTWKGIPYLMSVCSSMLPEMLYWLMSEIRAFV